MKAQFFILGAILIVVVLFVGLPIITPILNSPSDDLPLISRNIQLEFPVAFNMGLNQSQEAGILKNFTLFINETLYDHFVDFSALWIISRNISNNVNFTIGNFLNKNTTVNLTISSVTSVSAENNKTTSVLLSPGGSRFNITIGFETQNTTLEWIRDKANIYLFYELRRGGDMIREEVNA